MSNTKNGEGDKVNPFVGLGIFLSIFSIFGIVYFLNEILPTPLYIKDEQNYPERFIAERAMQDLKGLTNIGPRPFGSYKNEILAVNYLMKKISQIQREAKANKLIHVDLQSTTGSIVSKNHVDAYSNLQNLVVKFHANHPSNHSLLINVHYDSGPNSPGGSDDGINCVAALEVIRKLSKSEKTLKHNIIFLFNGAEETGLHGSHAFITRHTWVKEIRVFLNFDSAGAGGKAILFQSGPKLPWLLKYYSKIPVPYAQVTAEELFHIGIIPSNTDFVRLQTYGRLVGLDLAFFKNGHRYHTRFDDFENIPLGSYQHVGDTLLTLVESLANARELNAPLDELRAWTIYYDFFGLFLIYYTEDIAILIYTFMALISVALMVKGLLDFKLNFTWRTFKYMMSNSLALIASWILGVLFVLVVAFIINKTSYNMRWFHNQWIILGLYALPAFLCSCTPFALLNNLRCVEKPTLSANASAQVQAHMLRVFWTVLLVIGTGINLRATYLLFIPIMFHALGFSVIQFAGVQYSTTKWQLIYIISLVIPTMFLMQQSLTIIILFIPIMGRSGTYLNSELFLALLTATLTNLSTNFWTPLITLIQKPLSLIASVFLVFLIFFIMVFTPLSFPYSGDLKSPAAQRFTISHLTLMNYNNSVGPYKNVTELIVSSWDYNNLSYINPHLKELSSEERDSIVFEKPFNVILNSKKFTSNRSMELNFTVSGVQETDIYIRTENNVTISTLTVNLTQHQIVLNLNNTYASVKHICGKRTIPINVIVKFETCKNWNGTIARLYVDSRYLYQSNLNTTTNLVYKRYLKQFPEWANVDAYLIINKNFSFS